MGFARHDPDRGGARAGANHRLQISAAAVLGPIGIIDPIVDGTLDRFEGDFLRHAGGGDPPRLLAHRGLAPTRLPPIVAADVEGVVDRDGPDPRWSAVSHAILAERRDVQVIGLGDLTQYLL